MRKLLLISAFSILTLTSAGAETRCQTTCNWNRCYSRCVQVYSQQELYDRAERNLDYHSRDRSYGSRYRLDDACTRALETGLDNDTMSSYGCRN